MVHRHRLFAIRGVGWYWEPGGGRRAAKSKSGSLVAALARHDNV